MPEPLQYLLGLGSGVLVGFTLGLVGGGGSILATPLMIYVVGVADAHVAIGTSAVAVAVNALIGLMNHARARTVKWRCGIIYGVAGMTGAFLGSTLGKAIDGTWLLALFALLMMLVGVVMICRRGDPGVEGAQCNRQNLPALLRYAVGSGGLSGFFGIGGGFLIVPGLIAATRMPMANAVGTSLIAISAFGLTTAANYARAGLIDWPLVGLFVAGGLIGSLTGVAVLRRTAIAGGRLNLIFAAFVMTVGACIFFNSMTALRPHA